MSSHLSGPARFDPVGSCIYCGSSSGMLSDEHVVPHGLSGEWVLPKASCSDCAKVTGEFERRLLRGPLLPVRAALGLKTRRPKDRPQAFDMFIRVDGVEQAISAPLAKHFTGVPLPIFPLPSAMNLTGDRTGATGLAMTAIYWGHVNDPEAVLDAHAADSVAAVAEVLPHEFARLVAKIAHGMAVAVYGLEQIKAPVLPDVILGRDPDIGRWVGCLTQDPLPDPPGGLHAAYMVSTPRGLAVAVQLFGWQPSPTYVAVVTETPVDHGSPGA